jgi:16S rRNA (cytosine967-C5)-methyltransferase
VLYRARPAIIEQSAELQARLLARAADWVRPGGSLVYAVCSLEPQEGEERIEAFLAERPISARARSDLVDGVTSHPRAGSVSCPAC